MKTRNWLSSISIAVIAAATFASSVAAAPVQFALTYTIKYAAPNPTSYSGNAFDVGSIYHGFVEFDDEVLASDGLVFANVSKLQLNLGLQQFTQIRTDHSMGSMGIVIDEGMPIRFDETSIYDNGDQSFIDSRSGFASGPPGFEFYAKLYAKDLSTFSFINVAGDVEFERVPEPQTGLLFVAAFLAMLFTYKSGRVRFTRLNRR